MSENKHTPGPWSWDGNVWNYDRTEEAPWLHNESEMYVVLKGEILCASEADAHLIAAAPDLYEALSRLFNLANHFNISGVYFTEDSCNREALEMAEAALAKAEGRAE